MTVEESNKERRILLFLISVILMCACLYFPQHVIEFAVKGLDLCGRSIIPSLFPFMVFSDMMICSRVLDNVPKKIGNLFEKLFKIRSSAIGAFLIGALCGFPLGIKYASELYKNNRISKDECERLICFVNNTGPSFVIAGIGAGIRKNALEGVALYVIQIISSLICGVIFSFGSSYFSADSQKTDETDEFSLSDSVRKSALNMVYICGFITFFSIICGLASIIFENEILMSILSLFLEVGNSAVICSRVGNEALSFSLCAAAISFSGMSVHMQSSVFISKTDISTKRYYFAKVIQGIISFLLAYIIFAII